MGDALLADFQPAVAAPVRAARFTGPHCVGNGSVARHFWETALGLHRSEREVFEDETREAWDIRRGALRLTRLEIAPIFSKIELLEWEGCSGKPIRNAKHPWDYGLVPALWILKPISKAIIPEEAMAPQNRPHGG